jgi:hypothetical protein
MKRHQVLTTSRLAGEVMRYHTWPMHHRQTVGEHTWQVMRIYWQIWGPLPPELSSFLIWHDAGEIATGDIPFPVKAQNPTLKAEMDALEDQAVTLMGGLLHALQEPLKVRAKACDIIDMYECGKAEVVMGNKFAQPIVDDTYTALERLPLSPDDSMMVFKYLARSHEVIEENGTTSKEHPSGR